MPHFADDPIIGNEDRLPLYLVNMGKNDRQFHAVRPEGYWKPQIIYCTEGSGTLIVDGRTYLIEPFMGFFLPADYPHEYYTNGDIWDTHWVVPDGFSCDELLSEIGLSEPTVFHLSECEDLERCFRRMHEALVNDSVFGNYKASGLLYDFLIELYRVISGKGVGGAPSAAVVRAVDFIDINFHDPITLDQLSGTAGVTKQHLCRLFKSSLGCRPMEYITKRRLKEAKHLLIHTTLPIETIAEKVGFCSAGYLSQMFRRYNGITPGEYRRNRKHGDITYTEWQI